MSEPKPFASLGPTLLARKGGARPAMRSHSQPFERLSPHHLEDLGWNDMGHEGDESQQGADVLALTPPPGGHQPHYDHHEGTVEAKPTVRLQQEEIARKVNAPANDGLAAGTSRKASARRSEERRNALDEGRRAAFTLRVDAERHLKLRLACTIRNLSAQQIVTEALDKLLADIPDLEALASRVKRK